MYLNVLNILLNEQLNDFVQREFYIRVALIVLMGNCFFLFKFLTGTLPELVQNYEKITTVKFIKKLAIIKVCLKKSGSVKVGCDQDTCPGPHTW